MWDEVKNFASKILKRRLTFLRATDFIKKNHLWVLEREQNVPIHVRWNTFNSKREQHHGIDDINLEQ